MRLAAGVLLLLFLALGVAGISNITTKGNRWFSSSLNKRVETQKQNVIAGDILDRNGVVLATTVDGQRVYQADEKIRTAMVHLLGDSQGRVANGVESFQTNYLYGFQTSLPEMISSIFRGEKRRGDHVTLTVDSRLCASIPGYFSTQPATRGKHGAAVVMNYLTGEVIAEVSLPNFDPNDLSNAVYSASGVPYWNRATQTLYPPGSTFKIVTAGAALTQWPDAQSRAFVCTGRYDAGGQIIHDYSQAIHGQLSLQRAFTLSCNSVFCQLATQLGDGGLLSAARDFGFNDNFLFRDLVVTNSRYPTANRTPFEIAATGMGQSALGVTPTHLCMMAGAIANRGVMMEPRLLRDVTSPAGVNRLSFSASPYRTVLKPELAEVIKGYMAAVVAGGTGRYSAVPGLSICGKTGSAETSSKGEDVTHGWYVGFINNKSLPFAVAVVVEKIEDGQTGGITAGVIAGKIFRYLRDNGAALVK